MPDPPPPPPPPPVPPGGTGGDPPARKATALHYAGDGAPKIVASGRGLIADRIVALARESGVAVRKDAALAEALSQLDIGREIPEALYVAVAEALAWAYALDGKSAARRAAGR